MHGILLVDKPAGATSHDVVQWVRWALRERSVGHFGTLDPPATGLLVLGVGAATRLGPYFTGLDKIYAATFMLGRSTSTDDAAGETIAVAPVGDEVHARAEEQTRGLVGTHALAPPAVSAIKIAGTRAHTRVRRGEAVAIDPRPMVVHDVRDVSVLRGTDATVAVAATVHVSKGTYVRSLAVELGRRLGVPAHLHALRRIAVGSLRVDDPHAVTGLVASVAAQGPPRARIDWATDREHALDGAPDNAEANRRTIAATRLTAALRPITTGLPLPVREVSSDPAGAALLVALCHGQRVRPAPEALSEPLPPAGLVVVTDAAAAALVVAQIDADGVVRPQRVVIGAPGSP